MLLFIDMKKYFVLAFFVLIFCSKGNIEKEYQNLSKMLDSSKKNEEKATTVKNFLNKFPESNYTNMLSLKLLDLESPSEFEIFINDLIKRVKSKETKEDLKFSLIELYKKTKEKDKIKEIFNSFEKPLEFYHYSETIKALIEISDFEESLKLIEEAQSFCKMETIEKEMENYTEERKLRIYNRRNFKIELLKGRIYYGLNDFENSQNSFEKAKTFLKPSFVGTYLDDFNLHYAILLDKIGKKQEAISTILPDVFFERNEKNYNLFEKLYSEIYSSKEGIEDFLNKKKEELSPEYIDFNLKDYNGKVHNFSEISRDKIVLLTFWFPT